MRILTFTSLYPNKMMPGHGIFVENRLKHLITDTEIESCVIAPIPWFPFSKHLSNTYKKLSRVPLYEERRGIKVIHPRYLNIPKIGMTLQPLLMAVSVQAIIKNLIKEGYDFDLIDAHYFYPDGIAAAILGKIFKKKVVITARGSDVNVYRKHNIPRILIKTAANSCAAVITVSKSLKDVLISLSVVKEKITILRNGIDLSNFSPSLDRDRIRTEMELKGDVLLMVGRLVKLKGHHLVIEALPQLENINLLIVGDGEEKRKLENLAKKFSVSQRVHFVGTVKHEELKNYYAAADALVLASSNEGWPNVLLEAMACGTPVAATNVGGVSEVVKEPDTGVLIKERTADGLVEAINRLFSRKYDRNKIYEHAKQFSWKDTSLGQMKLFRSLI